MFDLHKVSEASPAHRKTRPHPREVSLSWRGRLALLLCAVFALLGVYHQSWLFLSTGVVGWLVALLMLLQFRVELSLGFEDATLRGQFRPQSGGSFRAGKTGVLVFELEGVETRMMVRDLELHHSAYLRHDLAQELQKRLPLVVEPGRRFALEIQLQTPVAGRFMLHGAALHLEDPFRLFRTVRTVHCPTPLRVLPAIPISRRQRQGKIIKILSYQQRGAPQRRVGSGTDLRDIRDYRPGDPRRLIAWKHSLRHRKLLCREFESESPITSYILLDIGQSMREGVLGQRKLDYASEVVSAYARSAIEERDLVGLITFDGKLYRHHKAASGQRQFHTLLKHLGELHQIVDRDFAHLTVGSLCQLVSQYLWQAGLLSHLGGMSPAAPRPTVEFVWDAIHMHPELQLPKSWESDQELIDHILRTFCKEFGIELPYRYHQWVTYKAAGLQKGIEEATRSLRGGQLIIVISDLGDILHWDGILRALRQARQHRHHVIFLSPFAPWFTDAPEEESGEHAILREMLTLEQWTWRKRIQKMVGPMGIPVLSLDAETAPSALLDRLRRLRLGGRF